MISLVARLDFKVEVPFSLDVIFVFVAWTLQLDKFV